MRHLLVGFGYCADYLAQVLLQQKQTVITLSRSPKTSWHLLLQHQTIDINQKSISVAHDDIIYYFIPPLSQQENDIILQGFLQRLQGVPQKIIYIGSSGVYGHHFGEWVNEYSLCLLETPRQKQRKSAETLLQQFAEKNHVPCALLRVAGIYGPGRIPKDAVLTQQPMIIPNQAPFINHIYVKDLARILAYLGTNITFHGILNIADGEPNPMGTLQKILAELMHYPKAENISFKKMWESASDMKKEFMSQNKKLDISLLRQVIKNSDLSLTPVSQALLEIIDQEKISN